MEDKHGFAVCLKQLIASRSVKPSQLAASLHVDDSLVRKWLAGSRVPPLKANYLDLIGVCLDLNPNEQLRLKKSQIYSIDASILTLSTPHRQNGEDRSDEHKQNLITLLHAVPETAFLLDAAGRVVAANTTAARRLGLPGNVLSRHFLYSLHPVKSSNGAVTKVAVLGMDITDSASVYARLKDSEEQLRLMYEHNICPILLSRPDGAILAANPAACAFFAMSEEELCAAGRAGIVDLDDPNLASALDERSTAGKATARLTFFTKDRTKKTALVSSAQFPDSAGSMRAFVMIYAVPPF